MINSLTFKETASPANTGSGGFSIITDQNQSISQRYNKKYPERSPSEISYLPDIRHSQPIHRSART